MIGTIPTPWGRKRLWAFTDLIALQIVFLMQAIQQLQAMIDGLYQYPNMRMDLRQDEKERTAKNYGMVWIDEYKWLLNDDTLNAKLWRLDSDLRSHHGMCAETLIRELEQIRDAVVIGVSRKKFAFIPDTATEYFEQEYLFGPLVHDKFPQMRDDIKDAGNCLAADLPTSAVFHLMRIAETGFRYAAKKAKVKLAHAKGKPIPIDFATWEKVIQGFNTRSNVLKALPKSPANEAKIEVCIRLSEQCSYFRDVWRDKTMHVRKRHNHPEAVGALLRVKEFITLLAAK